MDTSDPMMGAAPGGDPWWLKLLFSAGGGILTLLASLGGYWAWKTSKYQADKNKEGAVEAAGINVVPQKLREENDTRKQLDAQMLLFVDKVNGQFENLNKSHVDLKNKYDGLEGKYDVLEQAHKDCETRDREKARQIGILTAEVARLGGRVDEVSRQQNSGVVNVTTPQPQDQRIIMEFQTGHPETPAPEEKKIIRSPSETWEQKKGTP